MRLQPWQWILIVMIAAIVAGSFLKATYFVERDPVPVFNPVGAAVLAGFDCVGAIFVNLLRMVIVPLHQRTGPAGEI